MVIGYLPSGQMLSGQKPSSDMPSGHLPTPEVAKRTFAHPDLLYERVTKPPQTKTPISFWPLSIITAPTRRQIHLPLLIAWPEVMVWYMQVILCLYILKNRFLSVCCQFNLCYHWIFTVITRKSGKIYSLLSEFLSISQFNWWIDCDLIDISYSPMPLCHPYNKHDMNAMRSRYWVRRFCPRSFCLRPIIYVSPDYRQKSPWYAVRRLAYNTSNVHIILSN